MQAVIGEHPSIHEYVFLFFRVARQSRRRAPPLPRLAQHSRPPLPLTSPRIARHDGSARTVVLRARSSIAAFPTSVALIGTASIRRNLSGFSARILHGWTRRTFTFRIVFTAIALLRLQQHPLLLMRRKRIA